MATKTTPIKNVTSWSFSRYSDYKQCPLKFKLKHIDKIKEPPNDAMARGATIHTLAEDYIKGTGQTLPPELKKFEAEFKAFRKQFKKLAHTMVVEDNWAFTKEWDETTWDDWASCWVRIKLDCAHHESETVMVITDWKTGKFRTEMNEEYTEQLELYALAALLLHPHLTEVKPRLAYIDHGVIYPPQDQPLIYTPSDIGRLKQVWAKRTKAMMNDKKFAPKPNDKCRWCFFSASQNGPCKY